MATWSLISAFEWANTTYRYRYASLQSNLANSVDLSYMHKFGFWGDMRKFIWPESRSQLVSKIGCDTIILWLRDWLRDFHVLHLAANKKTCAYMLVCTDEISASNSNSSPRYVGWNIFGFVWKNSKHHCKLVISILTIINSLKVNLFSFILRYVTHFRNNNIVTTHWLWSCRSDFVDC